MLFWLRCLPNSTQRNATTNQMVPGVGVDCLFLCSFVLVKSSTRRDNPGLLKMRPLLTTGGLSSLLLVRKVTQRNETHLVHVESSNATIAKGAMPCWRRGRSRGLGASQGLLVVGLHMGEQSNRDYLPYRVLFYPSVVFGHVLVLYCICICIVVSLSLICISSSLDLGSS